MASNLGTVEWGIVPLNYNSSLLADMSFGYRGNYLVSCNQKLRYQIVWTDGTRVYEDTEPSKDNFSSGQGDVVNVVFKVYATSQYPAPSTFAEYDLLATIRKSRDIANKHYDTESTPKGHRFTIDISEICANRLSYSLVPINKGTWQSAAWGGMNGGLSKQDNVTELISPYNVTPNGSIASVRVQANFEIMNADGEIVSSTTTLSASPTVWMINSVSQFEDDNVHINYLFAMNKDTPTSTRLNKFMSRCPNHVLNTTTFPSLLKTVRLDEKAEWLYFYLFDISSSTYNNRIVELYGKSYTRAQYQALVAGTGTTADHEFVVNAFAGTLFLNSGNGVTSASVFNKNQKTVCVQNVSPQYINANAYPPQTTNLPYGSQFSPLDSDTYAYRLYVRVVSTSGSPDRLSSINWFKLDQEDEIPAYDFVRFHWLNSVGGIDSYTAKRNITEGYSINKDIIERKSPDRTWYQDDSNHGASVPDSNYISNTMRGGNLYKGGREVSSVSADRVHSVFTEPINTTTAEWLKELMLSPNVWVEFNTEATQRGKTVNPYQRPSNTGYMPVIITNSDIETINQEQGLVSFNIEYTLAHKVQTQRN